MIIGLLPFSKLWCIDAKLCNLSSLKELGNEVGTCKFSSMMKKG